MTRLPFAIFAGFLLALSSARATDVYLGVSGASKEAVYAIGLPAFVPDRLTHRPDLDFGIEARTVVRSDLLFSRRFKIVDAPSGEAAENPKGHSSDWRRAGAGFVLTAITLDLSTKTVITATLLDLASGDTLFQRYYQQAAPRSRAAAHLLSDDIARQLTGHPGIAHSQIAFVNDSTGSKELYIVDYDGENARRLTQDHSIDLLPRWSPDRSRIIYTSYKRGNPDLYEINLRQGIQRVFLDKQGLNVAGGFSPDGSRIALVLSNGKSPNVYLMSLHDLELEHLTHHFGVDASPTFSPDGDQIAYVSDRSGNPQVHILELSTGRTQRLTRLNWCDSPSWSPNGDWIVFAGRANSLDPMDIFLVDVTGSQIRQLTHGEGTNEDPSWSPDGRFIVFTSTRMGHRQLFVMDSDGSAPHRIGNLSGNTFTPSWSP